MNGIRVLLLVLIVSTCRAETFASVRGNVESDRPFAGGQMVAILEALESWRPGIESIVGGDGGFEFKGVTAGLYRVRLTTLTGTTITEELVNLTVSRPIAIQLPKQRAGGPVMGPVSAERLLHPIPRKALRAFVTAKRESDKGQPAKAAQQLELALQIYPDYFEARSNLGVQYLHLGRREEALEQFEKAAASAPPSAPIYGNISYTRYLLGKLKEAEEAARRALDLDRSLLAAHYVLGSILARNPVSPEKIREAVRHLGLVAESTPTVRIDIAKIEEATGDRPAAAEQLRLYLQSGDAKYRAEAERWLAGF